MEVSGSEVIPSAGEVYTRVNVANGLNVEGDHYHWKGSEQTMFAIHTSSYDMTPLKATKKIIKSLKSYSEAASELGM